MLTKEASVVPATFLAQQIVAGTVRQVINEFLVDRKARACSKRTIEFYGVELKYFTRFLDVQGVVNMNELTPDIIRKYLLDVATHRNKGGVHVSYRVIKAFLNWWQEETDGDFISPMKKIKVPASNTPPLPGIATEELIKLVDACTTDQALRDKAIIYTLFDSAVRAGELLALNIADVDPVAGSLIIRHGKGDKYRQVFVGSKTRKALRAYLRTRENLKLGSPFFVLDENERLKFFGLRQIIERASKRAGIKVHGLHDFRRGAALSMLRNGIPLPLLITIY